MAVLTISLTALRDGFNKSFPSRDKTSDGWIGDWAHQQGVSGHNPDDTPGSKSEYTDADNVAEVRAIDIDRDLGSFITMQDVIDRILRTPADLARLKYIIFNRRIWSRNTNWEPRTYAGDNPHDHHAHFSGDPNADNDGAPWCVALWFAAPAPITVGGTMIRVRVKDQAAVYVTNGNGRTHIDGALMNALETAHVPYVIVDNQSYLDQLCGVTAPVSQVFNITDDQVRQLALDLAQSSDAEAIEEALRNVLKKGTDNV